MTERQRLKNRMERLSVFMSKASQLRKDMELCDELWDLSDEGEGLTDRECQDLKEDLDKVFDNISESEELLEDIQERLIQLNDSREGLE